MTITILLNFQFEGLITEALLKSVKSFLSHKNDVNTCRKAVVVFFLQETYQTKGYIMNDGETCWLNSAFQFLNRTSITHILCGTKNII